MFFPHFFPHFFTVFFPQNGEVFLIFINIKCEADAALLLVCENSTGAFQTSFNPNTI
jgi:hypothetical protein